jgi:integrase
VDLISRIVRLDPGTTKNGEGREVPMTATVYALLSLLCEGKKPVDAVFTRPNGEPVRSFTDTWRNMCVRAGVGHWECGECGAMLAVAKGVVAKCKCDGERKYVGRILHDMRRSAARNYRRNGVAENVVMSLTGHKTRSMLDRYSIVNNDDKRRAVATLDDLQFSPSTAPEGAEALGKETTTIQ